MHAVLARTSAWLVACLMMASPIEVAAQTAPSESVVSRIVAACQSEIAMVPNAAPDYYPNFLKHIASIMTTTSMKALYDSNVVYSRTRREDYYSANFRAEMCLEKNYLALAALGATPARPSAPIPAAAAIPAARPADGATFPSAFATAMSRITPTPSPTLPGLPPQGSAEAKPIYAYRAGIAEGMAALEDALDGFEAAQAAGKEWKPPEPDQGEDASGCLTPKSPVDPRDFVRLVNTCPYRIEALWCVVDHDCKPSYTNMHTFEVGDSYKIYGTEDGNNAREIRWAACKGKNTIGGRPNFLHVCSKELGT